MARKFVRFVTVNRDDVTGQATGFFKAAYSLRRSGCVAAAEFSSFSGALDWFDAELDLPERFHRSTNPHAHGKALSWFKPEATQHIRQARIILAVMVQYGIPSEMVTTSRPGYVVYEDDHQICAIPFRDAR